MAKKVPLKKKLRYWIDERMSKGTASMVKLLLFTVLFMVILVTVLVVVLNLAKPGKSVIAIFWDNLRSAMSSSFPSSDSGSLSYIILYTLLGLTGMIFTGMLIGIFSSYLRGRLIALQKENPEIIEEGHTVILGFRNGEYALLNQLVAAAEGNKRTIVIAEDIDREEMEASINRGLERKPKNVRITAIKADPTSPNTLVCCNIPAADTIVINTREKGRTVKTLLAIEILLANSARRPKIVSTVDTNTDLFPKETLQSRGISMLHSGDVIARIIAHTGTQTGIYEAFMDMISFEGNEFYFEDMAQSKGLSFGQVVLSSKKGTAVGILRDGEVMLNPPSDTQIRDDDCLVVFEEKEGSILLELKDDTLVPEEIKMNEEKPIEEVTIFGINQTVKTVINELPDNIKKIKLIGITSKDKETYLPDVEGIVSEIVTDYRNTEREYILTDMIRNSSNLILLSDRRLKEEDSDTETMLRIIRLRDIKKKHGLKFTVTAEMRCENNRKLITSENSEDFVVATDLSSMMLAQITEDTRRVSLFNDLLDETGSELYLKNTSTFGLEGVTLSFEQLREKLYASRYLLIGLRTPENPFKVLKDGEEITLGAEDRLILIGQD